MKNQLVKRKAYWNFVVPVVNPFKFTSNGFELRYPSTIEFRKYVRSQGCYLPPKNNFTVKFSRVGVSVLTD